VPRPPNGICAIYMAMLLLALLTAGCAAYRPANAPLSRWAPDYGYRPARTQAERPMGDVLLVLAFSGGGTRAAALSYGVLQELRDTRVVVDGVEKRLLDEVDLITSVSGGSFTSAYYALYGDRIFVDFEQRFLRRNIQGQLFRNLLNPLQWVRLASTFFDRSELAVQLYDNEIFDHATFADLQAAQGPFVQINAADLAGGNRFTFFQPQFDLICSDLSQLKVARAVAASSAVPGLFTPITLRSYAGQCGFESPAWFKEAGTARQGSLRRFRNAEVVQGYLDGKRKYIHLVDGGIADNLGLRGPLDNVILVGGLRQRFDQLGGARPAHIMFVVVNAEVHPEPAFSLAPVAPSLSRMISSVSGVQIYSYNFETLELMRASLKNWQEDISSDAHGRRVQTYIPEIVFKSLEDPAERTYFNALPTSFQLDNEAVDRLIAVGRRLLRASPEFQRLIATLQADSGRAPLEATRHAGETDNAAIDARGSHRNGLEAP
jgi:NTE family protein